MFRQNYTSQKPENVLQRVNELIASSTGPNADKEKQFALEQLHTVVSSSKRKQWSKVYEQIMQKHMELCVDLKDNRLAKDGLHQYRNMVQNVSALCVCVCV
jgi:translation initiation factor 3 subunit A